MSIVLPPPPQPRSPHHFDTPSPSPPHLSRPSTPPAHVITSRNRTPQPTTSQPISAPPTPVTPTHIFHATEMERCRSSEAALSRPLPPVSSLPERNGRAREVKATSLLLSTTGAGMDGVEQSSMTDDDKDKGDWEHVESTEAEGDDKMDVDEVRDEVVPVDEAEQETAEGHVIWGMPKWGWEEERKEVRPGVRLVGMEELPTLLEQHSLIDTPSHALFPWLHGISDDGQKGRDMAAFFGYAPPFEPPSYRGLCVLQAPPHPLDNTPPTSRPMPHRINSDRTAQPIQTPPRDRSETMSTSSESYHSSGTTEGTSPSVADWKPITPTTEADVQMHPCESKKVTPITMTDEPGDYIESRMSESETDSEVSEDEPRPSCLLLNSVHVQEVFDLPKNGAITPPRFRAPKLPNQINLRNLNIQQIKYASISDLIIYAKNGVGNGVLEIADMVARAQDAMWQERMEGYYNHVSRSEGEGLDRPIRYGVWVVVEPFHKIERFCPDLIVLDSHGEGTLNSAQTDLFEREARESRAMTKGSEVVEGFWVGNDCDVPGGAEDGAGATISFDLCLKASECADMPSTSVLNATYRKLQELDRKPAEGHAWTASPATIALRNLLSPSPPQSPDVGAKRIAEPHKEDAGRQRRAKVDTEYVSLECAGSCRTVTGLMRNLSSMTDKVVELVYFLRKIIEGRDKSGIKRRVLVHCQDGYTESSIIVLSYIMSSLSVSLPEAYLHLQQEAGRSFFLYPSDKPLLRKIDARLASDRRAKALKLVTTTPSSPGISKWKWGMGFSAKSETPERKQTVQVAKEMLVEDEAGGSQKALDARVWFEDRRFDGFPSRILPFLYLGNLEHAGNAAMLQSLDITHVVSVGESLINCPVDCDPMYGRIGQNCLSSATVAGKIKVLDLADVRDDGNDPLRPMIARACTWIEQARSEGGKVLVHCRVGVSRSASIVMAYMMQYQRMGLMDAYLLTRARRLNVLIQPNLRFFHELFGWEVELARREQDDALDRRREAEASGVKDQETLEMIEREGRRRVLYSWPSFCRDLYCLNRRFLCN